MKSQLGTMFEIWSAILSDAALLCDLLPREVARDLRTAERSYASRGLGFFCLDLPHLDGLLLELLEEGVVSFCGPLSGRRSKRDRRPKFLWELWSRVCNEAGVLVDEPDPDAIASLRMLSCFFKKLEVQCADSRIEESVQEFYAIEQQIRPPTERWHLDDWGSDSPSSLSESLSLASLPLVRDEQVEAMQDLEREGFARRFDRVAGILVTGLGAFDSMSEHSPEQGRTKHGPGAVSNLKGSEYKYSFPYWSRKLEGVFPFDWLSGQFGQQIEPIRHEKPAKLIAVPKTAKGPRLIASEPVEHQWCQQKIATCLAWRYRHSRVGRFIALHDQSLSQRLVAQASLDQSLSTIDLSSASDRIATWHIEALFRSNPSWLEAMHAVRTRWLVDGVTNRDPIRLRKFSTQGSALTFPVQSLFFLCIALATCTDGTKESIDRMVGKVRIFGDDIIIPKEFHTKLVHNLTVLGLKVNKKKSFFKGSFRESCGADYWGGYDVTPVKPQCINSDAPESVQSLVDTSNNLFQKGWWRAAKRVEQELPAPIRNGPVLHKFGSGVSALRCYSGTFYPPHLVKWSKALQTAVVRVLTLTDKVRVRKLSSHLMLSEFFTTPHSPERAREVGMRNNRGSRLEYRWVAAE